jgi:hypothetical protein
MKYFDVDTSVREDDKKWLIDIGNNISEPAWTIRPYKLNEEEMNKISYIWKDLPVPSYAAVIMVPANTICKTHVDDKAEANGVRQRITAINIPLIVHPTSTFQYMEGVDGRYNVVDSIDLISTKCWRVDIPHRVNNELSPFNRVVLSLSYTETIDEIHKRIKTS